MNQKIQDLAEESGMTGYVSPNNKYLQRFAELIVKQCIAVCENGYQSEFTMAGITQCVADLKSHFGVK